MTGRVHIGCRISIIGLACLLSPVFFIYSPALAQSPITNKVVRVDVPVYEDNLEDAKNRAIRKGRYESVRNLILDLVAKEWVHLFDKELRRGILNRGVRYVQSYRVQKLEPSPDRTRYHVVVSVRLNRQRLVEDLREIPLPLKGDPIRPLTFFFARNDPVLRDARVRDQVADKLRNRLKLLNYNIGDPTGLAMIPANLLTHPLEGFKERIRLLKRHRNRSALFLRFEPLPVDASRQGMKPAVQVRAFLYQKGSGSLLAEFEQQARSISLSTVNKSAKTRKELLAKLVLPLLLQIQPGSIRKVRSTVEEATRLRLRVIGFRSAEEQELFERVFFKRNSPFAQFSLYSLAANSVSYEGRYRGDRAALEQELQGRAFGDFKVRRVFWYNGILEMDVSRDAQPAHAEIPLFPPEKRPPDVAQVLEIFFEGKPELEVEDPIYAEVEDNGWLNRANRIPFDATVYAYMDARNDKDLFVGEELASGEKITLIWQRISQSKLTPTVRFYDHNGALVSTFHPKTWLRYRYKIPKGQHRFYVEISDRFGYLKVDTGGYLNFHYLLKVRRESGIAQPSGG